MQCTPVGVSGGIVEGFTFPPVSDYLGREGLAVFEPAPELKETDFAGRTCSVGYEPAFLFRHSQREFWRHAVRVRCLDYDFSDARGFFLVLGGIWGLDNEGCVFLSWKQVP